MTEPVTTEGDETVAIIRINRPKLLNAVNAAIVNALGDAIQNAVTEGARCIVLTGEGRAFCSGADLTSSGDINLKSINRTKGVLQQAYHPFLRLLRDCPVPLITAVNGPAVGAGMSIALAGDIITASRDAFFLQAFARVGLVPDCAASWLIPRLIGSARARELSLLGDKLSADTALEWGMINRVYDSDLLISETLTIARKLADGPIKRLVDIRKLYWASFENGFEEQLNLEDEIQYQAMLGAEFAEGMTAFAEKRPPNFRDLPD